MPRLQARHLNVEFNITGANTGLFDRSSVDACAPARILGYLPDVRTAYNDADIFVAPLHSGNGMRVKLLEALSMGKAVVATRLAVAGFSITPEEHLLLAETPQDFAFQVERLLSEPSLRARLGENARKLIKENYDWDVLRSQFLELVEDQDG
jgi:glycosyltransferase involved in cell wall biosynthesis